MTATWKYYIRFLQSDSGKWWLIAEMPFIPWKELFISIYLSKILKMVTSLRLSYQHTSKRTREHTF